MQVFLRDAKQDQSQTIREYQARWRVTTSGVTHNAIVRCVVQFRVHVEGGPRIWSLFLTAPEGYLNVGIAQRIKERLLPHIGMAGDTEPKATPCGRQAMCLVECRTFPFANN